METTRDIRHLYLFSNDSFENVPTGHRFEKTKQSKKHLSLIRLIPSLISSVKDMMMNCKHLSRLEISGMQKIISGLPLKPLILESLSKGLHNNTTIKELSLARCKFGDSGVFILAPSLKTLNLLTLNISGCKLTSKSAYILSSFLKSLAVQRQADEWVYNLRKSPLDRLPSSKNYETPHPLRRLIICENCLGDEGCDALLDLINDQTGLKGMNKYLLYSYRSSIQ